MEGVVWLRDTSLHVLRSQRAHATLSSNSE
jgi:hypothetical protein